MVRVRQAPTTLDIQVLHTPTQVTSLFDNVVTPTIMYGAGAWTSTKEHENLSAQHSAGCFVSSFRQQKNTNIKNKRLGTNAPRPEDSTNDEYDQDSSFSFENDTEAHQAKKRS